VERLLKLLALTASTNDGEALAALRAAQAWMDREGYDWATLLGEAPRRMPVADGQLLERAEAAASTFADREFVRAMRTRVNAGWVARYSTAERRRLESIIDRG
jgi:hypothetical protein